MSRLFQSPYPFAKSIDFRVMSLLRRKDNSSQDHCRRLQALKRYRYHPKVWFRNINLIPFRGAIPQWWMDDGILLTALASLLGSTHPWSITVPMEPFPTSVFKVLIWIFATTTKICTRGCSTPAHAMLLHNPHALLLANTPPSSCWRPSIGSTLKRHPFSGLVHSAGES